jgi:bifunctional non-homologous end joining protein LigD
MTKLRFGRLTVDTSNEDKLFFPEDSLSKGDLIAYYRMVADVMIPHLRDRPLVMQRFPDGIGKQGFYSKDTPSYFPDWIENFSVQKKGGSVKHVVCNNAATLIYLVNQGAITFHTWSSRVDSVREPDRLIVDLDPPEGRFGSAVQAAFATRRLLEDLGLPTFVKTTGGKGLHVVAPIHAAVDFEEVRQFGRDIAKILESRDPDELTAETRKNKRRGRLFLDVGRNAYAQHAVAPYSVRPTPGAPVSTPLEWDELSSKLDPTRFTIDEVTKRLSGSVDPWSGMGRRRKSLTKPRETLDELLGEEGSGGL